MTHCCKTMAEQISYQCKSHADAFDCPDILVCYIEKFNEYGLIIHDGGSSSIEIHFCPWCGTYLPESKREQWFDELKAQGFENPFEQEIPSKYQTDEWYRA